MNVLSVDMAEYNSDSFNSLLRIKLRYNGTTYTYDKILNVWKDDAGNINKKILMYNEDGTVANLASLDINGKGKYVRFVILGITLQIWRL